jgi:hypothetical protein
MLLSNDHLSRLAAAQVDFHSQGMLEGSCLSATQQERIICLVEDSLEVESRERGNGNNKESQNQHNDNEDDNNDNDNKDNKDNNYIDLDCGPVDGPTLLNEVFLAQAKGMII